MISIQNVYKGFGSQEVLKDVSFEVLPGQTTTIVGPSGVGKSVLLKLIMGLMQPDSGKVYINNQCITDKRSETQKNKIRELLGVLFQSAALFDSLSVYDNISFPLKERTSLSRTEIHKKVLEISESLGLIKYLRRYTQEISLGIRKRVGMARALIMQPKILLCDEPNTGLDPLDGQEVYDLINLCKEKWKLTGVVISHEIPEVFQVSDKVVMLLNGKIIEQGSPEEIRCSSNPAVQQFLNGSIDGPIKIQ